LKSAITEALEQARQKKRVSSGSAASGINVEIEAPKKPPSTKKASDSKQFKSAEFITSDAESEGGERKVVNKPTSKSKKRAEPPGESSEKKAKRPKKEIENDEKSESEMSALVEEPPKKRKSSKTESKPGNRGSKKKTAEPLSNDEETIKRLKSLVVACGVRKVWSKVFEGMDKPSQQIKKLKEMLSDLGMKGRHSMEQAKAIREKRELAQELEDVQMFEKSVVGKERASTQSEPEESEDDDVPETKRRKGRNARQSIMAFLQDQSESK